MILPKAKSKTKQPLEWNLLSCRWSSINIGLSHYFQNVSATVTQNSSLFKVAFLLPFVLKGKFVSILSWWLNYMETAISKSPDWLPFCPALPPLVHKRDVYIRPPWTFSLCQSDTSCCFELEDWLCCYYADCQSFNSNTASSLALSHNSPIAAWNLNLHLSYQISGDCLSLSCCPSHQGWL